MVRRGECVAYLAITRQVDFERLRVVLEAERRHGEENVLAVDRLALLLLAFLRGCANVSGCFAVGRGTDPRW